MNIRKIFRILSHSIERHDEKSRVSEIFHDVELIPMALDAGTSTPTSRGKKFKISKANRGTTIKIVALIVIVGFFFIHPAFAQTDTTNETLQSLQDILDKFISVCSRGRVILAILAGKLMTNDFVYGAFLHMDVYLWKIRNIMKNFANFALIALVIGSIIKSLVGKEAIDVKKIITNTLVAGVLIQASRFLMGAVIDLSTVATAGISAFPTAFLNNDAGLRGEMNDAISKFQAERIVIDLNATNNEIKAIPITGGTQPSTDLRKNMLPSYNSISGPFIFLGMGVFNFQKYLTIGNADTVPTLTLEFALRFLLLFFFTISLLLLVIANIMRVGLLRIFIIGAPFLILITLFKSKKEGGGGILGMFSLSNLIATVFKPVIFVIGISLMLIVIVSMQHGILYSSSQRENNLNGVTLGVTGTTSTLAIEGITNVEVNQQGFLGKGVIDEGKNIFSQLLMLLLTMFLMRRFVKLSLTLGGGTIGETMKGLIEKAETMAKSAPVLPFKGGVASLTAVKGFAEGQRTKFMQEGFGMSTKGEFTEAERNFQNMVDEQFLGIKSSRATADYQDLQKVVASGGDFMGASTTLGKKKSQGLSLGDTQRKAVFDTWFAKKENRESLFFKPSDAKSSDPFFDQYFKGTTPTARNNRIALHKLMGGDDADNSPRKRTTDVKDIPYDDLLKNEYWKSAEKTTTTTE